MKDVSSRLEGQEWQNWATLLLHRHYPVGDYQEVPDKREGDAGIEGYSLDGRVYQMYGPEGELTFAQRHTKLRDKITRDINKFINNKEKLNRLFGSLKIKRWILLVPSFENREIVEHAVKKTGEVLEADLPYVDKNDFRVVVMDEDAFYVEKNCLLNHQVSDISIVAESVIDADVDGWSDDKQNVERVNSLVQKLAKLPTLQTIEKRKAFQQEVIRWWLEGQSVLEGLRDYPDAWESIRQVKSEQEKYLRGHCMITNLQPYDLLMEALKNIENAVEREASALSTGSRTAVAHEAISEWLMRCPLDFPEI